MSIEPHESMTQNPKDPRIYIVIPVFNESENVEKLCRSLMDLRKVVESEFITQYVIVDDGSSDDTITQFNCNGFSNSLIILQHEVNIGPGAAFGTAFDYLANKLQDNDLVLTIEGDNTSKLEILQDMLLKCNENYDVVLASPYAPGGKMTNVEWHRLFLSHAANILARWILGLGGIYTLSSFYRLYRGAIIKKLQLCYGKRIIEFSGFECAVEILVKLYRLKALIAEVPMKLDFSARKGKTKMRILRTIQGYFRLFIRSRFYKKI
jgi:dolichol-phosphate mannosyltransferase